MSVGRKIHSGARIPARFPQLCWQRRHFSLCVRKSGDLDIIEVFGNGGHPSGMTANISAQPLTTRACDHRLREHVVRCGTSTVAMHVQIPRSTV